MGRGGGWVSWVAVGARGGGSGRIRGDVAMAFKGMGMFGWHGPPPAPSPPRLPPATPCPSASVHVSLTVFQLVIFHLL